MGSQPQKRSFQAPKGTRDFYPQEMLRRRYITDAWRRVSLRHGFEEIDGPTFEHLDLYTVKSGEGIVSELFSFQRAGGDDTYALRPEFTPSLARMYAARAKQLPQPTKWFCIPNFFRAERPQRGRLREFFQWNVDVIGDPTPLADAEVLMCAFEVLSDFGLSPAAVSARTFHRSLLEISLLKCGIDEEDLGQWFTLIDRRAKIGEEAFVKEAIALAQSAETVDLVRGVLRGLMEPHTAERIRSGISSSDKDDATSELAFRDFQQTYEDYLAGPFSQMDRLDRILRDSRWGQWSVRDPTIVRGLAYYTGMVFEVIAEGERAVAGGGRYDNLIELFGGPPTPACGFGMGDVVLGNLLEDKGLIPEGRELLEALSRPMPLRPDAFVISSGKDGTEEAVTPLVAQLRRGKETARYSESQSASDAAQRMKPWDAKRYAMEEGGCPPMHARRSYKATKNVGKLLGEANNCHARFAVIVESAEMCSLKDFATGEQVAEIALGDVAGRIARAVG